MDTSLVQPNRLYRVNVLRWDTDEGPNPFDGDEVTVVREKNAVKSYLVYGGPSEDGAIETIKGRFYSTPELQRDHEFKATRINNAHGIDDVFEE